MPQSGHFKWTVLRSTSEKEFMLENQSQFNLPRHAQPKHAQVSFRKQINSFSRNVFNFNHFQNILSLRRFWARSWVRLRKARWFMSMAANL